MISGKKLLPIFPDGEDKKTMQDHSERLRQKSRVSKEKQDTDTINNLMVQLSNTGVTY